MKHAAKTLLAFLLVALLLSTGVYALAADTEPAASDEAPVAETVAAEEDWENSYTLVVIEDEEVPLAGGADAQRVPTIYLFWLLPLFAILISGFFLYRMFEGRGYNA